MTTDKKNLPKISIISYDGDLSKKWCIEWWEGTKRFRRFKGINQHQTVKDRTQAAEELKAHWLTVLSGKIEGISGTLYKKQYRNIMAYIEAKKGAWRKSSYQSIIVHIKKFLEWNQRKDITKQGLEAYLDHLANIGRKKNTIAGYYKSFRLVIGNCLGEDLLEGLQVKRGEGVPARYFSEGQIRFLSKNISAKDPELWMIIRFIFFCFIRPAELRLLKVGDIILEDGKICIPAAVSKNRKTQYVVIPDKFLEEIYPILLERNPGEYLVGGGFSPVGKNWLSNKHQKLLKEFHFNTEHHKLYSWKHTGAVTAVKNGVHIKQLQLQLRHHSLDQVNEYLRQLGVLDLGDFASKMPAI